MRTINVTFSSFNDRVLALGIRGENNATEILIDCTAELEGVENGMPALTVVAPNGAIYPGVITIDEGIARWVVNSTNTAIAGRGQARIDILDGLGTVIRSTTAETNVIETIGDEGEQPEPVEEWIDEASATLAEVKAALEDVQEAVEDAQEAVTNAQEAVSDATDAVNRANAAAEAIEDLSASATTLPPGQSATAEVTTVDNHKHIAFGIPKGDTGAKGDTGDDAGFGSITASVDQTTGTPTVTVTTSGPDTAKNISFAFSGLKGETGSGSVSMVNGILPDRQGDVTIKGSDIPVSPNDPRALSDTVVESVNGQTIDDDGEITLYATDIERSGTDSRPISSAVMTVNSRTPDASGNVVISTGDAGNVGGMELYAIIQPAQWTAITGGYRYTISNADIQLGMNVVEVWLDDESVQTSTMEVTVPQDGQCRIDIVTKPTANLGVHISLVRDGAQVIEDITENLAGAMAKVLEGDTNSTGATVASGTYVYLRGHSTLSEGLYKASSDIANGATLSGSNLTSMVGGGLNILGTQVADLTKKTEVPQYKVPLSTSQTITTLNGFMTALDGIGNHYVETNPTVRANLLAIGLLPSNEVGKLEARKMDANNFFLTYTTYSNKQWIASIASGTLSGWQALPPLTTKSYTVNTTANTSVSPFSAYGTLDLTNDINDYGNIIAIEANNASTNPVLTMLGGGRKVIFVYSATAKEGITLVVTFAKNTLIS